MEPIRPLGSSIGCTLCAGGPHCEPLRLGVRGLPWPAAVTIDSVLKDGPRTRSTEPFGPGSPPRNEFILMPATRPRPHACSVIGETPVQRSWSSAFH